MAPSTLLKTRFSFDSGNPVIRSPLVGGILPHESKELGVLKELRALGFKTTVSGRNESQSCC